MKIKFKDGKEIKFKKYGKIWLADSVIWEKTELKGSLEELGKLEAKITDWFAENAPEKIKEKYVVRLPTWKEIASFPFKWKIAYREGMENQICEYILGDKERDCPVYCGLGFTFGYYGWFYDDAEVIWGNGASVRLCLEEKK